ncbi:MAG: ATP-binding protein [Thermoguttaceae bacterium]
MDVIQFTSIQQDNKPQVTINAELCKGCGLCVRFCPTGVLEHGTHLNGLGYINVVQSAQKCEKCTGCGNCFYICPEPAAISVKRKNNRNLAAEKRRAA